MSFIRTIGAAKHGLLFAMSMAMFVTAACHRETPAPHDAENAPPAPATASRNQVSVLAQTVKEDPCAWLDRAAAEQALGETLASDPVRVWSTDNHHPAARGEACLYKIQGASPGVDAIAVQVMADEPGVLRETMKGMQVREPGLAATQTSSGSTDWDFVAAVPGGLSAWIAGRFTVMVGAPGQDERVTKLVGAVLAHAKDLPFTSHDADPAVLPRGKDPCSLITAAEASADLGAIQAGPFRSATSSALAHGAGGSCTYYLGKLLAVVLTPTWDGGGQLFQLLGVTQQLSQSVGTAAKHAFDEGQWDAMTSAPGGALDVLKGERSLDLQYSGAGLSRAQAIAFLNHAFSRL
jgi:hypothetical protein